MKAATLAGAAAFAGSTKAALAQGAAAPANAPLTIKSVERMAKSSTSFAYAIKAGPWNFLNGHEAFDFESGLTPEVEGPAGYRLSGRPPLRREAG